MTDLNEAAVSIFSQALGTDVIQKAGKIDLGGHSTPVRFGVVRFQEDSGYNSSFAMQWGHFRTNQIDDVNGTALSLKRFSESRWKSEELKGKLVLEAGCGAGWFTRILANAGARLLAFDYSDAIDVGRENNKNEGTVAFSQCDIFDMPFRPGVSDYVFCHGVLQHTPDPEGSFRRLVEMVRPGGRISVDVYRKDGLVRPWKSKYLWRWLTARMSSERLSGILEWYIPKWLPIDTQIKRILYLGNYLGAVIPCWNYWYTYLSPEQKVQWAIMDTFDALAPAYDIPVTIEDVERWFEEAALRSIDVHPGGNGVVGNAVKPV